MFIKLNIIECDDSYLKPKSVKEKIQLEIDININQLTTIDADLPKCKRVSMETYSGNDIVILKIGEESDVDVMDIAELIANAQDL